MIDKALEFIKWLAGLSNDDWIKAITAIVIIALIAVVYLENSKAKDYESRAALRYEDQIKSMERKAELLKLEVFKKDSSLYACEQHISKIEREEKELYRRLYLQTDKNYQTIKRIEREVDSTINSQR